MHFFEKHLRHDAKNTKTQRNLKQSQLLFTFLEKKLFPFLIMFILPIGLFYHSMAHNNAFAKLVSNFKD